MRALLLLAAVALLAQLVLADHYHGYKPQPRRYRKQCRAVGWRGTVYPGHGYTCSECYNSCRALNYGHNCHYDTYYLGYKRCGTLCVYKKKHHDYGYGHGHSKDHGHGHKSGHRRPRYRAPYRRKYDGHKSHGHGHKSGHRRPRYRAPYRRKYDGHKSHGHDSYGYR